MNVSLRKSLVFSIVLVLASLSFVSEAFSQVSLAVSPSAICSGGRTPVTFTVTSNAVNTGGITINLPPGATVVSVSPTTIPTENGKTWSAGPGPDNKSICLKAPDNSSRLPTNSIITITAIIDIPQASSTTPYTFSGFSTTTSNTCPTSGTALTGNAQITINAAPTATINYVGSPYCASGTATVSRTGQGGGTYSAPTGLSIDASTGTINLATSVAGTYVVTYSFSDGTCSNTATTNVEVKALPVVAAITGSSTVCMGAATQLNNTTAGGVWSSSNTGVATVNSSGVVTGVAAGTATISYAVTINGCTTTKTHPLTVNAVVTPSVTISSNATNNTACAGTAVTFTAVPTNGGSSPSYQWKANGNNVGSNSPTFTTSALSDGEKVSVVLTSSNACASPATASSSEITMIIEPTVSAGTISGYTTALCIGGTVDLNTDGASDGNWSSSDAIVASVDAASGLVTAHKAGTATITYTVNSNCGSPKSASVTVTVNANVSAGTITGTTLLCMGTPATLSSNGTAGGSWTSSDENIAIVSSTGVVTPMAPGTATITYTVNSGCGLSSPVNTTAEVTVNALPVVAEITGPNSVCVDASITLSNATTGGAWTSSDNNIASVNSTGVVTGKAAGSAIITYSVTQNGCTTRKEHIVTVNALPVVAEITGPNSVCVDASITLSNATTGGAWTSSDNNIASVNSTGVVTGKAAGSAIITYSVTQNGCTTEKTKNITVNAVVTPSVTISSSTTNNTVCSGTAVTFTAAPTNPGSAPVYQWQKNGINISGANSSTYTTSTLANGDKVKVILTSNATCASLGTVSSNEITMIVEPSVTAGTITGYSGTLCIGGTVDLNTDGTTKDASWSSSDATVASVDAASGLVTAHKAGTATITYTVNSGCGSPKSASVTVTVNANVSAGTISGTTLLCMGTPATLSSNGTAGGSWSSSNGAVATVNSSTGVVTPVAPGTATITYMVNSGCGSPVSATKEITVNARPTASITSTNTTICSGSPTNITGSVTAAGAWTLTFSDGTTVTGTGTTTFSKIVTPTNTTTYTLTGLTDAYCTAITSGLTGSTTVTTQSVTATPVITSPLCQGTTYISGTLSESNGTVVEIYKNNILLQTTTVSKNSWSISGIAGLVSTDVIRVSATATGKCSATTAAMPIQPYLSAPVVNSPIYSGALVVSGTSTEPAGTTIEVFIKNTTKVGQATVSATGEWTANVTTALSEKDVVTARASAPGKCQSTSSSGVTVQAAIAGTTGDYRSVVPNGNWTDLNSWEIKNNSNWSTPNPTQGWPGQNRVSGNVTIQSGTTITTVANVPNALGGLVVDGTLNVDHNLTIVAAKPVNVNGRIRFNSTAFIGGGGTGSSAVNFTLAQAATLSTAHPSGITLFEATGSVQTIGTRSFINDANYTYNGSTQQVTGNGLPPSGIRTLTVDNPNGLRLSNSNQTVTGTTNLVNGALIIPAGSTLNLKGPVNVTQPGATIGGSISGSATSNLTIGGSGAIPNPLIFSGTPAQLGDFQFLRSGSGAIISSDLSVAGVWTNNAGGLLNLGTSRITFNGSISQSIGGSAATTFTNLTINNTSSASEGVNLISDVRINGNLTLTAGNLNVKTKVLTLGAAATVTSPGEGHMIIASEVAGSTEGELRKIIAGPGSHLFPVGDNMTWKYTPVTMNVKSGTGFGPDSYISLKVRGSRHPNNGNVRYYLKRYWLAGTNLSSFTYDFIAKYDQGDVVLPEDESIIVPARWKGQNPWERFTASTINTAVNEITLADQTGPGEFTGISRLNPDVTITANPGTSVCSGTMVTLTTTYTGNPPTSYLWSNGAKESSITVPVTETQTYTVTGTDANGFTGEASIILSTSTAATNNTISSPETAACSGAALATITGSIPSGGSGTYSYAWQRSFNGVNWSTAPGTSNERDYTPVSIPTTSTNPYSVYFRRLVNSTGCAQSISPAISIRIKPLPTATISGGGAICAGDSKTLTISGTPGAKVYYSFGSDGTGSVILTGGTATISVIAPAATTTYTLTSAEYTDAPSCTQSITGQSATVTVNVKSADPISATASATTICTGSNSILTLNGGGGGTGEVIKWYSGACGSTVIGTGNNLSVTPGTTTTYYGRYETLAPCSFNTACASVTIIVLKSIGGTVSADQTICYNTQPQALILSGNTGGVVKWQKSGDAAFTNPIDIPSTGTTLTAVQIGSLTQSTYFRAVVQSGQCEPANSSPALITVRPALTATISGGGAICAGDSKTLTISGTPGAKVYYSFGSDGTGSVILTGGTATISVIAPAATTTYTLTSAEYTDAPSCTQSITGQSATVTVNPRPTATISYAGSPYCASGSAPVTQTGKGGGTYSAPAGLIIDAATGTINLASSVAGTYTVTYNFTDGTCQNTTTTSVTVNTVPVVADITGPNTVCVGSPMTIASATTGGVWSSSNTGIANVDPATGVVSGVAAGTAIITYAVTNNGCTTEKTHSVTVNTALVPSVTISSNATNNTICSGTPITFTATPNNGGTPSYQWQKNGVDIAGATSATYTTNALANGDAIKVIMASTATCAKPASAESNTITTTVTANVTAGTITGYEGSLCIDGTVDLNTDGTSGGTWSSSNEAVATVDPATGVITAVSPGSASITYTVSTGCGSPKSASVTVNVNANVTAGKITGNSAVCMGNTITLSSDGTPGGAWSSSDLTVATVSSTGILTPVAPGLTTIRYTVNSGCGTPVSTTIDITVFATPTATISYSESSFCANGSATVTITGQTGGSFSAPEGLSINGSTGAIDLEASTPGTYTVTYNFSNANCSNETTTSVTINPLPVVADISGSSSVCVGSTTILSNTTIGGEWISDDPNIATVNSSGVVSGVATGNTTISYEVIVNGCSTTKKHSITVSTSVSTSVTIVSNDEDNTICSGTPVTFTATPVNGGATPSYQWKVNGNFVGTNSNTYTTSTLNYLDVVTVALTSSEACANPQPATSNAITTTVAPSSVGGTASSDQSICYNTQPQDLTLSGNTGEIVKWQKSQDAAFTSPEDIANTSSITTLAGDKIGPLTQTTYFRAVVQSGACTPANSAAAVITVNPELTVSVSDVNANNGVGTSPNTVYIGYEPASTLTLTASVTGNLGAATYQWSKDNVVLPDETSQTLTVSTAGNYSVIVTSNGCTGTASKQITAIDVTCASGVSICENGQYVCEPMASVDSKLAAGAILGSCPTTIITKTREQTQEKLVNTINLKAFPNPTASSFTVVVESDNQQDRINLRVMDLYGRTVEIVNNVPNRQTLRLGTSYRPGIYFIELIQGDIRKQLKVIKQPD